jgi:hypothetical protein
MIRQILNFLAITLFVSSILFNVSLQGQSTVDSAFSYLRITQDKFHNTFDVYTDQDAAGNHFTPSGWMTQSGYDPAMQLEIHTDWLQNPYAGTTCIKITNTFLAGQAPWAGIYWLYPDENWGTMPNAGYDLTGADSIVFYARGENGGETLQFFAFGVAGPYGDSTPRWPPPGPSYVQLDTSWTRYVIDIRGKNLSYIIGGFAFVVEPALNGLQDITFYLDNIQYFLNDSTRQQRLEEPRFLLSYEASLDTADYNEDFSIRNAAFVQDNAVTMLALMSDTTNPQSEDWDRAKRIGDAFHEAQMKDRYFQDNRLRNGYMAGDLTDRLTGFARLPSWWDTNSSQYSENEFAAGSYTGNMAWIISALLQYHKYKPTPEYLTAAQDLGGWVRARYDSISTDNGYRGGFEGFDENQSEVLWKSVEHNVLVYVAFKMLNEATGNARWYDWAMDARNWVETQWNIQQGNFPDPFTNLHSLAYIFLGNYYEPGLTWVENYTLVDPCPIGDPFSGFDYNDNLDGVWFEGTGQMACAFTLQGDMTKANLYLSEIEAAQNGARNADERGIVEACHDSVTTGITDPSGNPTFKINRLHSGSTSWYVLAKLGRCILTEINQNSNTIFPATFELKPNYPNPFNPNTTIEYGLPRSSDVTLTIYNLLGQKVRILQKDKQSAGVYTVIWDGKDEFQKPVASGMYLYRIITDSFVDTRKMLLLR